MFIHCVYTCIKHCIYILHISDRSSYCMHVCTFVLEMGGVRAEKGLFISEEALRPFSLSLLEIQYSFVMCILQYNVLHFEG